MPRIPIERWPTPTTAVVDGRTLLAFGGCNYLGLAHEPRVHAAVARGLTEFGLSTNASRETTGNTLAHEALERDLSEFLGQEHAILSAEGYTANFMVCQALAKDHGVALIDQRAHRSIRNAASASGMHVMDYEHLNADSAAWLVKQFGDAGVAIIMDSVFAADGGLSPLPALLATLPAKRATLVVDDCHGFCVLGRGGRGAVDHFAMKDPRVVITTTLAKGLGCYGGCVAGSRAFVDRVRERAWVYRSSTPVPPSIARGAQAALGVLREDTSRVTALRDNAARLRTVFQKLGLPLSPEGIPIFTFALDNDAAMETVERRVLEAGILAPLIDYPGGPCPRYFRVVVNAAHTPGEIDRLGETLAACLGSVAARAQAAG
jgi:7-keto-8-aminopelargonate synthetase-like enzyme